MKVFQDRAENYPESADLVMLRAVEKFEQALRMAVRLTNAGGRIALMIGSGQVNSARELQREVIWDNPVEVPCSLSRELLVGTKAVKWDVNVLIGSYSDRDQFAIKCSIDG